MSEVEQLDKLLNLLTDLNLLEEATTARLEETSLSPKKVESAFQNNDSLALQKKESSLEYDSLLSQIQNLIDLPIEAVESIESISYATSNDVEEELPINQVLELIQSLSFTQKELNPTLNDFEEARELPINEELELIQSLNYFEKKLVNPTLNEVKEARELPVKEGIEPTLSPNHSQEDLANLTINDFKEAILDNTNKTEEKNNSTDEINQPKELDDPLEGLKRLLIVQEMTEVRDEIDIVEEKLGNLERRIYDPNELSKLLLPLIAQVLSLKIAQSKEEVVEAIVPIISEVIQNKINQDKEAMAQVLSTVIPDAIAQQIKNSPQEISQAIAPTMGAAIKQQIVLERDSMVDALYPIIGSTVSKYMVEVVNAINEKIENTLSPEGFMRKIRAKIQGVSEAELILRESMPFRVKAIFLIHKTSGLLISEMQQTGAEQLESEMVAGMLTAIRSFANDCMVEVGKYSELNEIEYDNFKLVMEVAGYCYLVVVSSGDPPQPFIQRMRQTLGTMIQKYGKEIEEFDGDPATIPKSIPYRLEELINSVTEPKLKAKQKISPLMIISLGLVGAIAFWGWSQWRDRTIETTALNALESAPELAVYRLETIVRGNSLKLKGKLPNRYLREKAALIAMAAVPDLAVDNQILAIEVPPDPVKIEAEVKRTLALFNQTKGTSLSAISTDLDVTLQGKVSHPADLRRITEALKRIPGLKTTVGVVQLQPEAIATRIYFDANSSLLTGIQRDRLDEILQLLRSPDIRLKIIGHTDGSGSGVLNEQLARQRAMAVKNALIALGIAPQRLQVAWSSQSPPNLPNNNRQSLSRCVRFEPILEISN